MSFQLHSQARYTRVDAEGVLLLQQAGEVLVLNDLGMRVIELMDKPVAISTLVDRLISEFEVDRATLERDVDLFVQELADAGALEPG